MIVPPVDRDGHDLWAEAPLTRRTRYPYETRGDLMKKTLQEKLQARQINPPNGLLYSGLMQIVKLLNR